MRRNSLAYVRDNVRGRRWGINNKWYYIFIQNVVRHKNVHKQIYYKNTNMQDGANLKFISVISFFSTDK